MLMIYKRNRSHACYDTDNFPTTGEFEVSHHPVGPFASCGGCPYAGHGFICYTAEGNCLKENVAKLKNHGKAAQTL